MYSIIDGIVYVTKQGKDVTITEYFDKPLHTDITFDGTNIIVNLRDYLNADVLQDHAVIIAINGVEYTAVMDNGHAVHELLGYDPSGFYHVTTLGDWRNGELVLGEEQIPIDEVGQLKTQVNELTIMLGDLLLEGGL